MKIGFFTYGIYGARMTGIARYTIELTRALKRLEPALEIILLNPYPEDAHPWYQEFETYPLPQLKLLPFAASLGHWQLHRAARDLKLDILHDPCQIAPFLAPRGRYKRITTVHDAIPFIYPNTQPLLTRLVFHTLVRAARHTADAVLTVSQAAARDLEQHVGIPKDHLFVTPNGVAWPAPVAEPALSAALEKLSLVQPYFLYVGALHPRKNIERVTAAFLELHRVRPEARLAIVGPPSWGAHATLKHVLESAKAAPNITFTGFVTDHDLHALYQGAHALVFPSLYEGFGLPALEAMAHGTPVITSNVSSLPEVVGDAGLLVDPTSTAAITQAMLRLLDDQALRSELSSRSLERARLFSWEHTAQLTLELYRRLVVQG